MTDEEFAAAYQEWVDECTAYNEKVTAITNNRESILNDLAAELEKAQKAKEQADAVPFDKITKNAASDSTPKE